MGRRRRAAAFTAIFQCQSKSSSWFGIGLSSDHQVPSLVPLPAPTSYPERSWLLLPQRFPQPWQSSLSMFQQHQLPFRHLQFSLILIQFGLYRCPATAGAPRRSRFKEVTVSLAVLTPMAMGRSSISSSAFSAHQDGTLRLAQCEEYVTLHFFHQQPYYPPKFLIWGIGQLAKHRDYTHIPKLMRACEQKDETAAAFKSGL
jgi:hypothetical protein